MPSLQSAGTPARPGNSWVVKTPQAGQRWLWKMCHQGYTAAPCVMRRLASSMTCSGPASAGVTTHWRIRIYFAKCPVEETVSSQSGVRKDCPIEVVFLTPEFLQHAWLMESTSEGWSGAPRTSSRQLHPEHPSHRRQRDTICLSG